MKIKEYWLLSAVAVLVMGVAFVHDWNLKADAAGVGGDKIIRERWAVAGYPDPAGGMTPYVNFAAYGWHLGTVTPDRADGGIDPATGLAVPGWPVNPATGKAVLKWPILAEYNGVPSVVWYWGRSFRTSNGSPWGKPLRWAYVRQAEEVWNATVKQWEVPGLNGAPAAVLPPLNKGKAGIHMDDVAGQQLVDMLRRSFTWAKIQDFGDLSPYDEPDTGAPLGPGAPKAVAP